MGHLALSVAQTLEALPAEQRDARIIALCDRAIDGLNEARSLEEVFGIRNAAEAFATYTRKYRAAVEAQNQCQLVVLLAEARIGAELKAAQERGEVGSQGRRSDIVRASDEVKPTIPEIGIPRQRASEMKKLAEAGDNAIREEVAKATKEGRRPSRERITRPQFTPPAYTQHPAEYTQFVLWLRTGAQLSARLGSPGSFRRGMAAAGIPIPPAEVTAVVAFLSCLEGEDA